MIESTSTPVEAMSLVNDISEQSIFESLRKATKLRNALRMNAVFSMVSGIVMVAAAGWLAARLGLGADDVGSVRSVGVGLIVFAGYLLFEAAAPLKRLLSSALQISAGDGVWVVASVALIVLGTFSTGGAIVVGVVALIVANFAALQFRARNRTRAALVVAPVESESPPQEAILFRRELPVDTEDLWPVVVDHELYGQLAPNLGGVTAMTANGPGLVRECSDTGGKSWRETCTLWDPGERFAVDVETREPGYPYPLQVMQGTWGVGNTAGSASSSVVTMAFVFQPEPGIKGRAMTLAMHAGFGFSLRRIFKGWKIAAQQRSAA